MYLISVDYSKQTTNNKIPVRSLLTLYKIIEVDDNLPQDVDAVGYSGGSCWHAVDINEVRLMSDVYCSFHMVVA